MVFGSKEKSGEVKRIETSGFIIERILRKENYHFRQVKVLIFQRRYKDHWYLAVKKSRSRISIKNGLTRNLGIVHSPLQRGERVLVFGIEE